MMKKRIQIPVLIAISVFITNALGVAATQQPYRLSDRDMKQLVSRMEGDADRFRKSLHKEMEHYKWESKRDRESMGAAASGFEKAVERLKSHFHGGNGRPADIQEVLDRGAEIDSLLMTRRLLPRAESDWTALRGDLDQLASAYNISWKWDSVRPEERPRER